MKFQFSGDVYRSDDRLRDAALAIQHGEKNNWESFRNECSIAYVKQANNDALAAKWYNDYAKVAKAASAPRVLSGEMASTDYVIKHEAFGRLLRSHNRHYYCVEMEAGGAALSCFRQGVPLLAIRGVSDRADANKNDLEEAPRVAFRRCAIVNVMAFLITLLGSPTFAGTITALPRRL